MKISAFEDGQAVALLTDAGFGARWQALYESCPFACEYQSPDFTRIWFDVFGARYRPLCILGKQADLLTGVLWLAVDGNGDVHCAGHMQSEYHGWLAAAGFENAFPAAALRHYAQQPGARALHFNFLLPGVPRAWLDEEWRGRVVYEEHLRPIMDVTEAGGASRSLAKSANKSKLNRLKKTGALEFLVIDKAADIARLWPAVSEQHDRRFPDAGSFRRNPEFGTFFVEEMQRGTGFVSAFALCLDGRLLAFLIGHRCRDSLVLGVATHDEAYGAASPNKLLMLMAAAPLAAQGYRFLDLTPHGEWKLRFATRTEAVTALTVHPDRASALLDRAARAARATAKEGLTRLGADHEELKGRLRRLRG